MRTLDRNFERINFKSRETISRLLEEKMTLTNGTINPMIDLHLLASDGNNVSGETKYELDNYVYTFYRSNFRFRH